MKRRQLRIGGAVIPGEQLESVSLTETVNSDASLQTEIPRDVLAREPAELRGSTELTSDGPGPRFAGWVVNADVNQPVAKVDARSAPWLDEGRFETFVVAAPREEHVWSIGRIAGLQPDDMSIEGLHLQRERFLVATAIRNVVTTDDVTIAGVTFTGNASAIARLVAWVSNRADRAAFMDARCWAVVNVETERSLFDAEANGTHAIEGALDRWALDAQYSLAQLPTGEWRSFRREGLSANPTLGTVAIVAARSGRRWLRSLGRPPYQPDAPTTRSLLGAPAPGASPRFDEALAAWRRAVRTTSPIVAAVALWEALEFYAAESKVEPLFSAGAIAAVVSATVAVEELTDDQRARAARVLTEQLNSSPIMVRLKIALDRDRVPYTELELAALLRVRRPRNRFQHGELAAAPSDDDLELAKGFVARVLAYRGSVLTSAGRPR